MRITRKHWPVGQGLFTSGVIDVAPRGRPGAPLNYVYDCGARWYRNGSSLQAAVGAYVGDVDKIEALFVSHLDEDHVAGLDRLLANVKAETVYLPYVDEAAPILDVLEAVERGRSFSVAYSGAARSGDVVWSARRATSNFRRPGRRTSGGRAHAARAD